MGRAIVGGRWWRVARVVLAAVVGGVAGYLYWAKIGCVSGGCPITSDPWMTTGFGALMAATLVWPSRDRNAAPDTAPDAAETDAAQDDRSA